VGYTPLLECDAPSTGKRVAMKKKIIKNNNNNKYKLSTHLEKCTRQSCPVLTYLSQRLAPSIFTAAPPQYFPQLLPPSLVGGPLSLLISGSDLFALGLHDLGSFSPLQ